MVQRFVSVRSQKQISPLDYISLWRTSSSGMWRRVGLVKTGVFFRNVSSSRANFKSYIYLYMPDLRFSGRWECNLLGCDAVSLVATDVSEGRIASITRVERISELGPLTVTINRSTLQPQLLVTANVIPSSLSLFTLMMETIRSC
jgi:hypothetical protein